MSEKPVAPISMEAAYGVVEKLAAAEGYSAAGLDFFEYIRDYAERYGDPYKSVSRNEWYKIRSIAERVGMDGQEAVNAYQMVMDGFRKLFAPVGG